MNNKMVSKDTKEILNGLGTGAAVGIVGLLISGTSSWIGGPQLGYPKLSLKSTFGVAVSGAASFMLVGVAINMGTK